jgi:hypothetical protein
MSKKEIMYRERFLVPDKKDKWGKLLSFSFHVKRGEPYVEFHINKHITHWFGPGFVYDAINQHLNRILMMGMTGMEKRLTRKKPKARVTR